MSFAFVKTKSVRHTITLAMVAAPLLFFCGCAKPQLACPRVVKVPAPPLPDQRPEPVLFATDRFPESPDRLSFSAALNPAGTHMNYGIKCEDPARVKAECSAASAAFDRDEFLLRVGQSTSDVVLFVHGFNYTFDESLEIALRIVQRAKFPATPVAYSWPSQGRVGAYGIDYDMSEWTIDHLRDFIRELAAALPANARLHIVAQSMGNRAVLLALSRLDLPEAKLGQLILISPDVDTLIFRELMRHAGPFQRKTVYVSQHDLALRAAGFLHSGTIRAGDASKEYTVMIGVDTVDVSPLRAGASGHSVYDYSQLLFDDFGAVLKDEPVARRNLTACTVKSIQSQNDAQGTSLPCTVFRVPSK